MHRNQLADVDAPVPEVARQDTAVIMATAASETDPPSYPAYNNLNCVIFDWPARRDSRSGPQTTSSLSVRERFRAKRKAKEFDNITELYNLLIENGDLKLKNKMLSKHSDVSETWEDNGKDGSPAVYGMEPYLPRRQVPRVYFTDHELRDRLVQTLKAQQIPGRRYSKTADDFDLSLVWAFFDTVDCRERIWTQALRSLCAFGKCFMLRDTYSIPAVAREPIYWEFTLVVGRTVKARVRGIGGNIYKFDSEQKPIQYVIKEWNMRQGYCVLSTPDGEDIFSVEDVDLFDFLREEPVIELILN